MSEPNGRVALITGGGAGIGRACAVALADAGATVHIVDREPASAHATAEQVGGTARVLDLTDADALRELPESVDVLVNNAGFQHVAEVPEFDPDVFVRMQRLMVTVPFLLAQRCLPHMYQRGWGRIVNISSVHGLRASAGKSAYVAAKHGLEGLSKTLALEGAAHGVTSNCVNPGYVRTALVRDQLESHARAHDVDPDDVVNDVLLHRSAIKRLLEPEEVAAAVVWLCGPHSGYISGTSLPLDGAWTPS